jgi:hypothetical protein
MKAELCSNQFGPIYDSWLENYARESNAAYSAGILITQQYIKPQGSKTAKEGSKIREYDAGGVDDERGKIAQDIYNIMIGNWVPDGNRK